MLRSSVSLLLLIMLVILNFTSCSKDENSPENINLITANVIKAIGDTVKLISQRDSTYFGCSILGTEINGVCTNNAFISLSLQGPASGCVSEVGSFPLLVKYYKDKFNVGSAIFSNFSKAVNNGSIVFTLVSDELIEGTFTVTCYCEFQTSCVFGRDSVRIQGYFKSNTF